MKCTSWTCLSGCPFLTCYFFAKKNRLNQYNRYFTWQITKYYTDKIYLPLKRIGDVLTMLGKLFVCWSQSNKGPSIERKIHASLTTLSKTQRLVFLVPLWVDHHPQRSLGLMPFTALALLQQLLTNLNLVQIRLFPRTLP